MKISQIKKLYKEFHLPPHIQRHCVLVAAVAGFIGEKMNQRAVSRLKPRKVNLPALQSAALIHDLLRVCDITDFDSLKTISSPESVRIWQEIRHKYQGKSHYQAAHELMKERNQPEIAEIIRNHDFMSIVANPSSLETPERKILYYADKRVAHDKIVSLSRRLEEGSRRYSKSHPSGPDSVMAAKKCHALEKEICRTAGIKPRDINEKGLASYIEFLESRLQAPVRSLFN